MKKRCKEMYEITKILAKKDKPIKKNARENLEKSKKKIILNYRIFEIEAELP